MTPPSSRPFAQVDVFSRTPYLGNPVAVVLDADGLPADQMQRFAAWTNLSETTFLLPPTTDRADYRVRIFTPGGELPFAGHPTLGSAHAWLEAGGTPRSADTVVQECGAGLVDIRIGARELSFRAPTLVRTGELDEELLGRVVRALRIDRDQVVAHQWADNGPGWAAVRLASAQEVLALEPDDALMDDLMVGVVGPHPEGAPVHVEVRAFAGRVGIREDPVTGSLNAALAPWLRADGVVPQAYRAGQGTRVGRQGVVTVEDDGGDVWAGGPCVTCIRGEVDL